MNNSEKIISKLLKINNLDEAKFPKLNAVKKRFTDNNQTDALEFFDTFNGLKNFTKITFDLKNETGTFTVLWLGNYIFNIKSNESGVVFSQGDTTIVSIGAFDLAAGYLKNLDKASDGARKFI